MSQNNKTCYYFLPKHNQSFFRVGAIANNKIKYKVYH